MALSKEEMFLRRGRYLEIAEKILCLKRERQRSAIVDELMVAAGNDREALEDVALETVEVVASTLGDMAKDKGFTLKERKIFAEMARIMRSEAAGTADLGVARFQAKREAKRVGFAPRIEDFQDGKTVPLLRAEG